MKIEKNRVKYLPPLIDRAKVEVEFHFTQSWKAKDENTGIVEGDWGTDPDNNNSNQETVTFF